MSPVGRTIPWHINVAKIAKIMSGPLAHPPCPPFPITYLQLTEGTGVGSLVVITANESRQEARHERTDPPGDQRVLPHAGARRIDLRPPCGQRRQARKSSAQRRTYHDRHA